MADDLRPHVQKMELLRVTTNTAEFSLNFLRPAPPKMSVRPSEVRKRLFATYVGNQMPPTSRIASHSNSSTKRKLNKLNNFASSKASKLNSVSLRFTDEYNGDSDNALGDDGNDNDDDDDDDDDDSELEFNAIVDRLLNRKYHSETDVRQVQRSTKPTASKTRIVGTSVGTSDEDAFLFGATRLIRTLSDTVVACAHNKQLSKHARLCQDRLEL